MNFEDTKAVDTFFLSWVNRTAVTLSKYNFKRIYNTQVRNIKMTLTNLSSQEQGCKTDKSATHLVQLMSWSKKEELEINFNM